MKEDLRKKIAGTGKMFSRIEHELALLSGLINSPSLMPYVAIALRSEHFYKEEHRIIYEALMLLYGKGEAINFLSVADKVGVETSELVKNIRDKITTADEVEVAVQAIIQQWMLRETTMLGRDLQVITDIDDPWTIIESLQEKLFNISKDKSGDFESLNKSTAKIVERAQRARDGVNKSVVPYWGLGGFEEQMEGVETEEGEVIVVSGRPGHGKSSLFNNRIITCVEQKRKLVMWSGEMSPFATASRYYSGKAKIPSQHLKDGSYLDNPGSVDRFAQAEKDLSDHVLFDFGNKYWEELKPQIIHYHMTMGVRDFIIDRLELLYSNTKMSEEDRIKRVCGDMRLLSTKYGLRIDLAVQMRKTADDARDGPSMGDVLGGGASTADATKVILTYRPELYNRPMPGGGDASGKGLLLFVKNTFGPTIERYDLAFDKQFTLWRDPKGFTQDIERVKIFGNTDIDTPF